MNRHHRGNLLLPWLMQPRNDSSVQSHRKCSPIPFSSGYSRGFAVWGEVLELLVHLRPMCGDVGKRKPRNVATHNSFFCTILGSHGAGSLHETVTPLLLWGKNIRTPEETDVSSVHADYSSVLPYFYKRKSYDIKQADLCPLIASLLGVPIPANSVVRPQTSKFTLLTSLQ